MMQTHRRTTMEKCNLNETALQLYWNHTHEHISPRKFAAHPKNTLLWESTFEGLLLHVKTILRLKIMKNFDLQLLKEIFEH